jgi:hypothetical protein
MSFELLANELLFDLFEYLSLVDLFHSFNGLNIRINNIIIEYIRINKSIDLRLIYKEDLNIIRRRYIPLIVNEIHSIYLSDDDTNPHEIDLFLSRLFPLNRFQNVQSISFYNIYSIEKMIRIVNDLQLISSLTVLKFSECQLEYDPTNIVYIMNNIWNLSNLIDCYLDISFGENYYLITPRIISCSIKSLSIHGVRCGIENLSHLYEHTPNLENLSIDIWESLDDHQPLSLIYSLTKLTLKCQISSTLILSVLRKVPNLINLTVETKILNMDGHMWETVINKYLTKLKIFNLKMQFEVDDSNDIEEEIDRLIDSYQTQFWIDQHKWFIQCFCYTKNEINLIQVHTFPYKFKSSLIDFNQNENFIFKSTYPNDNQYLTYNYVQNLHCSCYTSEDITFPKIEFPNVKNLTLTLPYDDHFRFLIPRFDNLISLGINLITWGHNDQELLQLQSLLDQTPRLYYLKFCSWSSKTENKNKKVIISSKMKSFIDSLIDLNLLLHKK